MTARSAHPERKRDRRRAKREGKKIGGYGKWEDYLTNAAKKSKGGK